MAYSAYREESAIIKKDFLMKQIPCFVVYWFFCTRHESLPSLQDAYLSGSILRRFSSLIFARQARSWPASWILRNIVSSVESSASKWDLHSSEWQMKHRHGMACARKLCFPHKPPKRRHAKEKQKLNKKPCGQQDIDCKSRYARMFIKAFSVCEILLQIFEL